MMMEQFVARERLGGVDEGLSAKVVFVFFFFAKRTALETQTAGGG